MRHLGSFLSGRAAPRPVLTDAPRTSSGAGALTCAEGAATVAAAVAIAADDLDGDVQNPALLGDRSQAKRSAPPCRPRPGRRRRPRVRARTNRTMRRRPRRDNGSGPHVRRVVHPDSPARVASSVNRCLARGPEDDRPVAACAATRIDQLSRAGHAPLTRAVTVELVGGAHDRQRLAARVHASGATARRRTPHAALRDGAPDRS